MTKKSLVGHAAGLSVGCVTAHVVNYYLLDVGNWEALFNRAVFGVLNIWILVAVLCLNWEDE